MFFMNNGRVYVEKVYEIPEGSKQSRGTNIVNLLQLGEGERVTSMIKTADFAENKFFICVTKSGKIKRTPLSAFKNIRRHGLRCITLAEGDEIAAAHLSEGDSGVLVATHDGQALCFMEDKVRSMLQLTTVILSALTKIRSESWAELPQV